jgi:hypothetical protein
VDFDRYALPSVIMPTLLPASLSVRLPTGCRLPWLTNRERHNRTARTTGSRTAALGAGCRLSEEIKADFHFSTVVWGPWHLGVYLDANLPSLLADNNLLAFAGMHRVRYRIFTAKGDIPRIEASPAFQRAREIVPFELIACPVEQASNPIAMHHQLWRRSIDEARAAGAMILFVPPDVIWSNGSLGHVAGHFARGKRAVFMTYMRVISETCVPETRRLYLGADGVTIDAPSRGLVELALQHIHPLTLTYVRDSPNFPIHPEFILWPVPGEGFLMRVLVREMFAYDPSIFELNQQALLAEPPDPNLVHYITDSDDLFSLSLAPLTKDIDWYARPQRLDPVKIGNWWLTYDSPANDAVASRYFYVHRTPRTADKWRPAEIASDILVRRIAGSRELLRVARAINAEEVMHARQVLGLAIAETKLPRFARWSGPVTLLIPKNAGMRSWLLGGGEELLRPERSSELVRRMLHHVILGRLPRNGTGRSIVKTAAGGERELTWRGAAPIIDGVALDPPGYAVVSDWSYASEAWAFHISEVLPPARGMPKHAKARRFGMPARDDPAKRVPACCDQPR